MELELKYRLKDRSVADALWNDEALLSVADITSREHVLMKAVYFDTPDGILSQNDIAFRVRMEGEHFFAAIKWGGRSRDGYHERREVTIPVNDERHFIAPSAQIFSESEDGRSLLKLIEDRQLVNLLETRYLRRRMRIDVAGSLMEIAIDTGHIVTDAGRQPILEFEIELFAGDVDVMLALGKDLEGRYELQPEDQSKLAQGLAMIRQSD